MPDSPAAAAPVPPGWYDDGTGSGLRRWWSGAEWTEHVETPDAAGAAPRPTLPADRPVYSVWIWLIVLLPLLSYATILTYQPSFDYLNDFSSGSTYSPLAPVQSVFTPSYFLILGGSAIVYWLSVLFAWRDVVWLRAQGVERPFAWPWAFLGGIVYTIGRAVIVRRVARPRGLAPIWVLIAVIVVGFIVSMIWTFSLMAGLISHIPQLPSGYSDS